MLDQGWFIKVRPMGEEVTELVPDSCVLRGGESLGKSGHWSWGVSCKEDCGRDEEMTC